ncbi:DUF4065 domain-containing protein [Candidatus Saccharibacteria bacterium]|nr:DUF4065 domain-containing protein [Candidatus Saccharibacteria bacterium]
MTKMQSNNKNSPKTRALIEKLAQVRTEFGYSQEQMAEILGLKGRQSYAAVEGGDKGLTVGQMDILAKEFPGQFDDFSGAAIYDSLGVKKYRQMVLSMIKAGADGEGKITKTKLAKLVYLADFTWYYRELKPMSGLPYIKLEHGPVAQAYFQVLDDLEEEESIRRENSGKAILISLNEAAKQPSDLLSDSELRLINSLGEAWSQRRTAEIVAFTHRQLPWQICRDEEIIPYGLITQEEPEEVYGPLKI